MAVCWQWQWRLILFTCLPTSRNPPNGQVGQKSRQARKMPHKCVLHKRADMPTVCQYPNTSAGACIWIPSPRPTYIHLTQSGPRTQICMLGVKEWEWCLVGCGDKKPRVRLELTTFRLLSECSTTKLSGPNDNSLAGIRTRVTRMKTAYPNHLDYEGLLVLETLLKDLL